MLVGRLPEPSILSGGSFSSAERSNARRDEANKFSPQIDIVYRSGFAAEPSCAVVLPIGLQPGTKRKEICPDGIAQILVTAVTLPSDVGF